MMSVMRGASFLRLLGLLGVFSLFLTACAQKVRVSTIGEVSVSSLCIEKKENPKNPLLDRRVRELIRLHLEKKGIRVQEECKDYRLSYDYGVSPTEFYVPRILYGTGEVVTVFAYRMQEGKTYPETYTFITPPSATYYVERRTEYIHWLLLRLTKGKDVFWIGEASMTVPDPDPRPILRSLVKVLVDYLGKDTGRAIEVEVK